MLSIRPARPGDAMLALRFVRELADYERALDEVVATEAGLDEVLFGPNPRAFCDIAEWDGEPAGMALWFYNISTWRGRHGIYLEDLYVTPAMRGHGIGKALLVHLARRCVDEGMERMDWQVLDWNASAIAVYERIGARPNNGWLNYRLTGQALQDFAQEPE
jgi:GNAT superfamily N-acetyltransferase